MPLQATSGAASYDAFGGGVAAVPNYIEDVFSTYLYTGNSSTQTITNGIDLAGEGGLVWIKNRTGAISHALIDTARGGSQVLSSDTTSAQANYSPQGISAFDSSGFTVNGAATTINSSSYTYASWTFRKQPKFFDVVTYTGNGTTNNISHNLQSIPGCIIIKSTSTTGNWAVICRNSYGLMFYDYFSKNTNGLNSTGAGAGPYDSTAIINATTFNAGALQDTGGSTNQNGVSYVAYLFAHNAGGFGLTGTDNVISCGSFTTDASANASVTLGYEPQWVLIKRTDSAGYWDMLDNMRGMTVGTSNAFLWANTSDAEMVGQRAQPFATGFNYNGSNSASYIYIAIRRGPMKVPTSGTSVYQADTYSGTGASNRSLTTLSSLDFSLIKWRTGNPYGDGWSLSDRLRGIKQLATNSTDGETSWTDHLSQFGPNQNTVLLGNGGTVNGSGMTYVNYAFRRAPSTFDEVCWIGDGNNPRSLNHNLAVAPELIITKKRNSTSNWITGFDFASTTYKYFNLNDTGAAISDTYSSSPVYGGQPTASVFVVGNQGNMNISGDTYVTYMWATNAGVTKVGSYTGNGSSQTINCGFTGGSRFVLIKRTNSSGDWYVWDSARGIVSGNDPHLSLNTTAAEVTTDDTIDTDSTGFIVNQVSATNCNVNGASYIFLSYA